MEGCLTMTKKWNPLVSLFFYLTTYTISFRFYSSLVTLLKNFQSDVTPTFILDIPSILVVFIIYIGE